MNTTNNLQKDPLGPTVTDQVSHDPFEKVVRHKHCTDMIVIQTTIYDPNTRFWCVIELFEALRKIEANDVSRPFKLHYMFSKEFLRTYLPANRDKVRPRWIKNPNSNPPFIRVDPSGSDNTTSEFLANPGGGNYVIFKVGDYAQVTYEDMRSAAETWDNGHINTFDKWRTELGLDLADLPYWPILKIKIFLSHDAKCGWDEKFINMSNTLINGIDSWRLMQDTIATNQEKSALDLMEKGVWF